MITSVIWNVQERTGTWADKNILYVASLFYHVEIRVLRADGTQPTCIGSSTRNRSLLLGYVQCAGVNYPTHYVSFVPNTGALF